jgi:F-type H+-transporting ATPase subunit b
MARPALRVGLRTGLPTGLTTGLPIALLLALLIAAPARAAEGMPQLNLGNPLTLLQVLWLAIIFLGLYLLLSRWALPRVDAVLEQRAAVIALDLDAARQAKAEADAAVAELVRATRESQAAAAARMAEATARAKEAAARQDAAQNAQLEAQLREAEQRIGEARRGAMAALRDVATETAVAVVSRLTGRPADPTRVAAEVGGALAARAEA